MLAITSFHISPFLDSVLSHGGSRTPSGSRYSISILSGGGPGAPGPLAALPPATFEQAFSLQAPRKLSPDQLLVPEPSPEVV